MTSTDRWLAALTDSERLVVERAVFGGPVLEIASIMQRSRSTTAQHLVRACRKLNVSSRPELIAAYWQHRLRDAEARGTGGELVDPRDIAQGAW
jgi:DNA-binding CsgD family transcriptional regulator